MIGVVSFLIFIIYLCGSFGGQIDNMIYRDDLNSIKKINNLLLCRKSRSKLIWWKQILIFSSKYLFFLSSSWLLKYGFCKKSPRKNAPLTSWTPFPPSADLEKYGGKSVQLVRGSFFRKYFLWNPYFSSRSNSSIEIIVKDIHQLLG